MKTFQYTNFIKWITILFLSMFFVLVSANLFAQTNKTNDKKEREEAESTKVKSMQPVLLDDPWDEEKKKIDKKEANDRKGLEIKEKDMTGLEIKEKDMTRLEMKETDQKDDAIKIKTKEKKKNKQQTDFNEETRPKEHKDL
ncbi:hypothetical protein JYT51_02170 [Candidatus Amoebophilus asiaticus]|nr:hypothetical protein [Candidatus Amoebophilus asiaticus]